MKNWKMLKKEKRYANAMTHRRHFPRACREGGRGENPNLNFQNSQTIYSRDRASGEGGGVKIYQSVFSNFSDWIIQIVQVPIFRIALEDFQLFFTHFHHFWDLLKQDFFTIKNLNRCFIGYSKFLFFSKIRYKKSHRGWKYVQNNLFCIIK